MSKASQGSGYPKDHWKAQRREATSAHEGWLNLAAILDLQSRHVVGWAVSDRMKKKLAIRALDMAANLRKPRKDCIFHSDAVAMPTLTMGTP
jgi:transposase InsO family protein